MSFGFNHIYPRWVTENSAENLREVSADLYVGSEYAPRVLPDDRPWGLIVDFAGTSANPDRRQFYRGSRVLRVPFDDGRPFPSGVLDNVEREVRAALDRGVPVLLHCRAGVSRSASAAYALIRRFEGLSHRRALARVKICPAYPVSATLESARRWVHTGR